MLTFALNKFIFRHDITHEPSTQTPLAYALDYEDVNLHTDDGLNLSAWYIRSKTAFVALLYCHGNAGNIHDWLNAVPELVHAGCSILLFDYRGYGRSDGHPTETGLYQDGEAAWNWLRTRAARDGLPVSILGKSLGSAVAIHIAARAQPAMLILDSAFTSMREVIQWNAPWLPKIIVPKSFESLQLVGAVTCPTLVIHGDMDTLVPLSQGKRLYAALQTPKAMRVLLGATHNDIDSFDGYQDSVVSFLRAPHDYIARFHESKRETMKECSQCKQWIKANSQQCEWCGQEC